MLMTSEELVEFRKMLGLKQAPFGAWLAERLGQDRPYTSSEVSNWENGRRPIAWAVQAVIYKHLWKSAADVSSLPSGGRDVGEL